MGRVAYQHAEVDRRQPRALAVCDRCGMVYNHTALRWQYDWMGAKIANLRLLICPSCQDDPQEQRRQIILPRDPIPIEQPRPEPSAVEMNSGIWVEGSGSWLLSESGPAILLESQDTPTPQSSAVIYDWMKSS